MPGAPHPRPRVDAGLIHRSAWKGNCANFAPRGLSEVPPGLYRGPVTCYAYLNIPTYVEEFL